jgi:tetratricopeptide (TPR) repeat protein
LRENSEADTSVKKSDRYYVSNKSTWYVQALHWLAKTQLALGKYKQAENTFKLAFEAYDKFNKGNMAQKWEILVGWGRSYYLDGNFATAIPLYEQAIALTPSFFATHIENAEALGELANIYRDTGKLEKAEGHYNRAIRIVEGNVAYVGKPIKDYDSIRIKNFVGYAKLLRLQSRNEEAVTFETKAMILQERYK